MAGDAHESRLAHRLVRRVASPDLQDSVTAGSRLLVRLLSRALPLLLVGIARLSWVLLVVLMVLVGVV